MNPSDNFSSEDAQWHHLETTLATAEKQLGELSAQLKADQRSRQGAEERLQIIILTCHPERYRALDTAEFFELK